MATTNFENEIVNAISDIAKYNVQSAAYDQTVLATVVGVVDEERGIQRIKYQDGIFKAHTVVPGMTYPLNSSVYVLIPKSDFNEDARIILYGAEAVGSLSRALPVCMITVKSNSEFEINTRRGVETYIGYETPVPEETPEDGG